jgi:hypothetical protein
MKLFRKYKAICATMVVLVLCACCSKEYEHHTPQEETQVPITFGSTDVMTKGLDPLNYERIKSKRFALFAFTPDNQPYLEHRDVVYVESEEHWRCSPSAYWPFGTSLNFFAYAPYDTLRVNSPTDDVKDSYVHFLSEMAETGMPRLRFTPPIDVTRQPDFCVSVPALDKTKEDGAIHLSFHHTLTRVRFYANYIGKNPNGYKYRVTNLIIRGVEGSNVLTYIDDEDKPYRWDETDLDSPKTGTYNLSAVQSQIVADTLVVSSESQIENKLEKRYTYINDMLNGRLYLVPQRLTSSAEIELSVSVYLGNDIISILPPFIFKLPSDIVWEEEKSVSYLMSLNLENVLQSTMDVRVQGWNDSGNRHDKETLE